VLISDLQQAPGLTSEYAMIGHNFADVAHLCQRIAVMQTGNGAVH